MNHSLIITSNFIFSLAFFMVLYKKLNLPKRCFYKESIIAGLIGSILSIFLLAFSDKWYLHIILVWSTGLLSSILVILWSFYRDPNRNFDGKENIILSPADGRIIYIRKVEKGNIPVSIKGRKDIHLKEISKTDFINENCWLIGINMSILDVHVNRAPIDGEIILVQHQTGKLLSLKLPEADTQNERNIIIIKKNNFLICVVQIASRSVRRIKSFIKEGQVVKRGEKIGKIVFGSQVDIIVPMGTELLIRDGCHVYAGLTPIAKIS